MGIEPMIGWAPEDHTRYGLDLYPLELPMRRHDDSENAHDILPEARCVQRTKAMDRYGS